VHKRKNILLLFHYNYSLYILYICFRDDAETFLDLELKDLTIKHLKNKFTKETEILKSGSKCGLVVRLADSNPEPKHQVQLSTLYQRDYSQRKVLYTVELKRMPDQSEDKPWKVIYQYQ
jgi:hypothetical protein